ncbi:hypothetical protein QP226_10185, partial [Aerococcus urinae]
LADLEASYQKTQDQVASLAEAIIQGQDQIDQLNRALLDPADLSQEREALQKSERQLADLQAGLDQLKKWDQAIQKGEADFALAEAT